jgi:hypothetical protein
MTVIAPLRRAGYRVRQFMNALDAYIRPLARGERAEAQAWLPESTWPLFDGMPRNDQRHSLNVVRTLRAAGHDEPALMQAALLHDAAKSAGGVTLFHRIAVVLLKVSRPDWATRMAQTLPPARSSLRYPFWVHANHPKLGAEMAAAAGCDPLAVTLIRRHQETSGGAEEPLRGSGGAVDLLLTALRTADDDN